MKKLYFAMAAAAILTASNAFAEDATGVATFENFNLAPNTEWHGDENGEEWYYSLGYSQYFTSGDYSFANFYIPDFNSWFGFGYASITSTSYAGLNDQFKSCVGHGVDDSATYGVAYPDGTMWGEDVLIKVNNGPKTVPGFYITNSAWNVYAYTVGDGMSEGSFAAGDYFKLIIHGLDAGGNEVGSRGFCLADYRFENEADRYYIGDWTYVDLSSLGEVASFKFTFEGSRNSAYGLTTPTYFCFDNFGAQGVETPRAEGTYTGGVESISIDPANDSDAPIYNLQGIRVDHIATPGIYIRAGKKIYLAPGF